MLEKNFLLLYDNCADPEIPMDHSCSVEIPNRLQEFIRMAKDSPPLILNALNTT